MLMKSTPVCTFINKCAKLYRCVPKHRQQWTQSPTSEDEVTEFLQSECENSSKCDKIERYYIGLRDIINIELIILWHVLEVIENIDWSKCACHRCPQGTRF